MRGRAFASRAHVCCVPGRRIAVRAPAPRHAIAGPGRHARPPATHSVLPSPLPPPPSPLLPPLPPPPPPPPLPLPPPPPPPPPPPLPPPSSPSLPSPPPSRPELESGYRASHRFCIASVMASVLVLLCSAMSRVFTTSRRRLRRRGRLGRLARSPSSPANTTSAARTSRAQRVTSTSSWPSSGSSAPGARQDDRYATGFRPALTGSTLTATGPLRSAWVAGPRRECATRRATCTSQTTRPRRPLARPPTRPRTPGPKTQQSSALMRRQSPPARAPGGGRAGSRAGALPCRCGRSAPSGRGVRRPAGR